MVENQGPWNGEVHITTRLPCFTSKISHRDAQCDAVFWAMILEVTWQAESIISQFLSAEDTRLG